MWLSGWSGHLLWSEISRVVLGFAKRWGPDSDLSISLHCSNRSCSLGGGSHSWLPRLNVIKPWNAKSKYFFFFFCAGVDTSTGNREPVFCPGSSAGRPTPRKAHFVWTCTGGGPLGWCAGGLWRGEARLGAGGNKHGEAQQNEGEHASPATPQGHCFLSHSRADVTASQCCNKLNSISFFLLFFLAKRDSICDQILKICLLEL